MNLKITQKNQFYLFFMLMCCVFGQAQTNVWTGAESTYWNTPGNWSLGTIPSLTQNVEIPVLGSEVYPIVTGEDGVADCLNITVADGAMVTVNTGGNGKLRIAGTITSNGGIDAVDGAVVMIGTLPQVIPADAFTGNTIRNLNIFNLLGVTLDGALSLTGILDVEAGAFNTANSLTLKSSATATAMIAAVDDAFSSITGEMTIERYIPARRAFRLISSPTTGGTINSNWQEGGAAISGYGTDITGAGGEDNGFDPSVSNNPSLFTHNNLTAEWAAVTNTNTTLQAGTPYRLMVRGDRTVDQTDNDATPTNTVLRSTGTIVTGNVPVTGLNPNLGGFSFIGNPYQAPVDMEQVLADAIGLNTDFYYVWDPTQNDRGAYVTVNVIANTNSLTGSEANKYLQPGQAFFVQTVTPLFASLTFMEDHKFIIDNTTPNVYRMGGGESAQLRLTMYRADAVAEGGPAADGFVINFNDAYTNDVDNKDALKPVNLDENISTVNSGKKLSFESRSMPTEADVIPLSNTTYRATGYTYRIIATGLNNVTAHLHDKFTNTMTELANEEETEIDFTVDPGNPESIAEDRFEIVFSEALGTDDFTGNTFSIYPNPVQDNKFNISLSGIDNATVALYNALGQLISCNTTALSGNHLAVEPVTQLTAGIYMVQVSNGNKTVTKKILIK